MPRRCSCRATTLGKCKISRQQEPRQNRACARSAAPPEGFLPRADRKLRTASRAVRGHARPRAPFMRWPLLALTGVGFMGRGAPGGDDIGGVRSNRAGRRKGTSAGSRRTARVPAPRPLVPRRPARVHAEARPPKRHRRRQARGVCVPPRPHIGSGGPATQARQTAHIHWRREDPPTTRRHDEARDGWTSTERQ
jgi:hypothetical protein